MAKWLCRDDQSFAIDEMPIDSDQEDEEDPLVARREALRKEIEGLSTADFRIRAKLASVKIGGVSRAIGNERLIAKELAAEQEPEEKPQERKFGAIDYREIMEAKAN